MSSMMAVLKGLKPSNVVSDGVDNSEKGNGKGMAPGVWG